MLNIPPYRCPANMYKVDEYLYRSAFPTPLELQSIHYDRKITDIFNISDDAPHIIQEQEIIMAKQLGINYHAIPTSTKKLPQKNIEKFLSAMKDLKKRPNAKALIHCNVGVDRTGAFVVFYQLTNKLKTYADAISDMLNKGHTPEFHPHILPKIEAIAKNMKLI